MTFRRLVAAAAALLASLSPAIAANPVVSNLSAAQRPGTKLVDITYDLTADTPTVKVTLEISSDGGTTWAVPVTSVIGSIGNGVNVGSGKTIAWNAGVDWDGKFSQQIRFRVVANDLIMIAVEAGALPASSWDGAQNVDAFSIGRTEVTWSEWENIHTWAGANGYDIEVGAGTGPNRPVINGSWYQVLKWCNARSEKEGLSPVYKVGTAVYRTGDSEPTVDESANGYRLPSEKEWEFAARGGAKTIGYEYSGSNDPNAVAWYSSNSGNSTKDVATKQANELGIFDMSGNVNEWCFGVYSGSLRVVRGGSWNNTSSSCRVANRVISPLPGNNRGFRVARSSSSTGSLGSAVTASISFDTRNWTLSATTPVNGNISGTGSYLSTTTATVTATPSAGYLFGSWSGDASGSTNPLTLLMDTDKTVGANFVEDTRDPDNDGLTNFQEIIVHLTNPDIADSDGDGIHDGDEVAQGRSPIEDNRDPDNDGLTNYQEIVVHLTNPDIADSDGDGIHDGDEVAQGRSPLISEPIVFNLIATQRLGTKLVDITYDVTANTPAVKVTLEISSDGGATYNVPVSSASGSVGSGVAVGKGKTITWNAGVDWDGKFSPQTRFRVVANDLQLPTIPGFSGVAAGVLPLSSWAGAQSVDAFYMAKTEITEYQHVIVARWARANGYDIRSGSRTWPIPVTDVDWYESLKWCNARSEMEGLKAVYKVGATVYRTGITDPTIDTTANGYRLPSEKEWEFAARGGVETSGYAFSGSNDINAVAWYASNRGPSTPADVGRRQANELGLQDMSGNVWEWCFDDGDGGFGKARGGAYNSSADFCLVANRNFNRASAVSPFDVIGFRVARSAAVTGVTGNAVTNSSILDTRNWALAITPPVNGTVSGAGSYLRGSNATLTAKPSSGYIFGSWSADASGSSNPLTIIMDSDKTVGTTFVMDTRDPDSDGLTNYQEIIVHLTDPNLPDTDSDGVNDGKEVNDGTNPLTLSGNWQALLEDANGIPQGLLTTTLSSRGKWSATLDMAGSTKIRKATGQFALDPAATSASLTMTFPAASGLNAQTMTLDVSALDAVASGTHPQGNLRGFRLARGVELPTATKQFTMVIDQGVQDGYRIPAGIGWATGMISTKGSIALRGQLGDAQPIKASLKLGATGQALLWLKPYRNLSSRIGGVVSFHESGGIPSTQFARKERGLWWYRAPDSEEPAYNSEFAIRAEVGVRSFTVPANSIALAETLGLTQETFPMFLEGGGLAHPSSATLLHDALKLDASFQLAAVPIPGRRMAPWHCSVNAKTGGFSGTLDIAAWISPILPGKAAVSGVLFPSGEVDSVIGAGLIKIPVEGNKKAFRTEAILLSGSFNKIQMVAIEGGTLPKWSWQGRQSVDAFLIGKTEVTCRDWTNIRSWALGNGYDIGSVWAGTGPNRPVTNVSWHQTLKWCNALSEREGLMPVYRVGDSVYRTGDSVPTIDTTANGYRLPSEKEWEFAARGGVKTFGYEYGGAKTIGYEYSGSNDPNAVAWYSSNSGSSTQDVATKQANELGIFDMSGNVSEWCFDVYSGSYRVFRGGSWSLDAYFCRVADGRISVPSHSGNAIGFRVARSSVP